jgi:AAA family ATP:ADP antiporter
VALVLVPIASVAGYGAALVAPLIGVLMVARIAESTLDYSLSNTTRQALWLVTSPEAKYKAKQVVDTFVMRAGDSMSAGLVWIGARTAMSSRASSRSTWCSRSCGPAWPSSSGRMYAQRSAAAASGSPDSNAEPAVA